MSQTDSPDDVGLSTRAAASTRASVRTLRDGLVEAWLVAFGVVSVVGYGVRDGFQRRPAVGVIYTPSFSRTVRSGRRVADCSR